MTDFSHEVLKMLFGSQCPLAVPNWNFRDLLLKSAKFVGYTPLDYGALQWMHHRAWRSFFLEHDTSFIEYLLVQVKMGMKVPLSSVPREVRDAYGPRGGSPDGGNPTGGGPRRPGPGPSDPTKPPKKQKTTPSGASFASKFAADIKRGRESTKKTFNVNGKSICPNQDSIGELLGAEFMALLPPNAKPCLRHFLFGSCMYAERCQHAHKLTAEPSAAVLEGILERLRARIDALIAEHPKE